MSSDTSVFEHWTSWMARRENKTKQNKKIKLNIRTANLQRPDKETQHIKYQELEQTLLV